MWPVQSFSIPRSFSFDRPRINDEGRNFSVHQWTGVNRLHELGIKGKGTKIAIVDTGVDYSHEAVGLAECMLYD